MCTNTLKEPVIMVLTYKECIEKYNEESASVLINLKAQMITEKLKSMIRFDTRSTRYKDVFDIC